MSGCLLTCFLLRKSKAKKYRIQKQLTKRNRTTRSKQPNNLVLCFEKEKNNTHTKHSNFIIKNGSKQHNKKTRTKTALKKPLNQHYTKNTGIAGKTVFCSHIEAKQETQPKQQKHTKNRNINNQSKHKQNKTKANNKNQQHTETKTTQKDIKNKSREQKN